MVLNEISTIQDYTKVINMIKKSKSWTHEPFKVSRSAFAHPVSVVFEPQHQTLRENYSFQNKGKAI